MLGVEGRPVCGTRRTPLEPGDSGLPIRDLLFDERGTLRPLVNVYVDRTQVDDLATSVSEGSEIRLVAAVAGG